MYVLCVYASITDMNLLFPYFCNFSISRNTSNMEIQIS